MAEWRTTRCCSALALLAAAAIRAAPSGAKKIDTGPLGLFPAQTIWTLALNNQITRPPAFDDTAGYFAIEGDRLVAYDLPAGTERWIIDAKPATAPVAGGGLVFFLHDQALTAVDASDGSEAWTIPFADPVSVRPVWASGWLIVASAGGAIAAFRANDASLIWRRDLGSPAHAPPAVSGDRVYVPVENNLVIALRIESGDPVWQRRLGGMPNEILALDDRLFVGSKDNYFYCIDTADGRVDWRWRTGADVIGLPEVDEHRVYFVSLDNVLRALNRRNGVQQWIQMLKLRPIGGPVKAGSTIVVYGLQPPVRVFDLKDGKPAGDLAAGVQLAAPPHVLATADQPPAVLVITRDIAKGDTLTLMRRSLDPAATPFVPLPNPITAVPTPAPSTLPSPD